MSDYHPIRAAALMTGIPVDTLRAWERRHNAVTPSREGRERLYADTDIRRLILLRNAVNTGHAIRHVAGMSDAELEELEGRTLSLERKPLAVRKLQTNPLQSVLLDLIAAYDYDGLNEELGKQALLLGPAEVLYQVLLPLMRVVGEHWQKGVFEIAQEHMLSAAVRNLLGSLVRLRPRANRTGGILLTTPAGEMHEFGILAAAVLGVAHEVRLCYLGPNLPARDILQAARKVEPRVVVLGIMRTNATAAVAHDIRLVAAQLPAGMELWLGGTGASAMASAGQRVRVVEDLAMLEQLLSAMKSPAREAEAGR